MLSLTSPRHISTLLTWDENGSRLRKQRSFPNGWRTVQIDPEGDIRSSFPVSAGRVQRTLTTIADTVRACLGNLSVSLGSAVPKSWNWPKSRPFRHRVRAEVRIKVLAAGTGFTDTFIRRGRYPDFKKVICRSRQL